MATKTIINNRKANLIAAGVTLRPGENVIGEEKARKLAQDKQVKLWHSLGWIGIKRPSAPPTLDGQLNEGADEGVEGNATTSPAGPMSAKEAIAAVSLEEDTAVLEGMIASEDRKTVLNAIERRLAELNELAEGEGNEGSGGEG